MIRIEASTVATMVERGQPLPLDTIVVDQTILLSTSTTILVDRPR